VPGVQHNPAFNRSIKRGHGANACKLDLDNSMAFLRVLGDLCWGWHLRRAESDEERRLARRVALVSGVGMMADWVSGYYGFGSLMALLAGVWLMRKHPSE